MTETIILSSIGAAGVVLATLAGLVYTRVRSYRREFQHPLSTDSGNPRPELPISRYQPMFRLLSGEDADFLCQHRQCANVTQRWKRSQRRVIRIYLRELASDFQSLHRLARALVAQSPEHAQQLMPVLFRQQIAFWRSLIWIEVRLTLGGVGMAKINPASLVAAFEAVRREISKTAAPAQNQPA